MAKHKAPQNRIWPTTWYLGVDLAKTFVGWYQNTGHAYEIHGSIDFSDILLDVDYGLGHIQRNHTQYNGSFASATGPYFRMGLGYNFLTSTADHNQFFIGFRYARSFLGFQLKSDKFQCNHPRDKGCDKQCILPPPFLRDIKSSAIAHWWEIVAGGKVYLMHILSIGCTARYKFGKRIANNLIKDNVYALPFDIPGFGLAAFDHAFGYSLYILLRIPLQKSNKTYHEHVPQKSVT
ncbi:Membrane Protein of unknown function DUF6048 [Cardinium endosymbiont of Oedothorax gibbosus]|nr:Membrane Protein of unknown function DUF6048 [Cardinium endosymbiont of Oedothorax gibbosus]